MENNWFRFIENQRNNHWDKTSNAWILWSSSTSRVRQTMSQLFFPLLFLRRTLAPMSEQAEDWERSFSRVLSPLIDESSKNDFYFYGTEEKFLLIWSVLFICESNPSALIIALKRFFVRTSEATWNSIIKTECDDCLYVLLTQKTLRTFFPLLCLLALSERSRNLILFESTFHHPTWRPLRLSSDQVLPENESGHSSIDAQFSSDHPSR